MDTLRSYPAPHPQTAGRVIDGEAVIMLAEDSEIQVYNEVGSRIYSLCDGQHAIDEIVTMLVDEYNIDRETATNDVVAFVQELVAHKVLVIQTR